MQLKVRWIFLTITLFSLSSQVWAFRCGTKVIDVGERKYRVLHLCGEPSYTDSYDQVIGFYPHTVQHVEVWTYNFGRNKFMQELIFRNNILRQINTLNYGY